MALDESVGVFVPEGAVVLVVGGADDAVAKLVVFELLAAPVHAVPVLVDRRVVNLECLVGGAGALHGGLANGVNLGNDRSRDLVGLLLDDCLVDLEALQDGAEGGALSGRVGGGSHGHGGGGEIRAGGGR